MLHQAFELGRGRYEGPPVLVEVGRDVGLDAKALRNGFRRLHGLSLFAADDASQFMHAKGRRERATEAPALIVELPLRRRYTRIHHHGAVLD
jgi:hypothetical protein